MITLLLSGLAGCAVAGLALVWLHWAWALLIGVAVFGGAQYGAGRMLKSRLESQMKAVQEILMGGQKRLKQKMAQWQIRPPGSVKQAQLEMEKDQRAFIEKALEEVKKLEKWEKWSPLLRRQIATMKLQLHWQLRNMKEVDALMPRAMFLDPMSLAMRLARQIMLDEPREKIRKTFQKSIARMRYKEGALLYGIYSWSLVKRNDLDAAHKILIEANNKLENETLKRNKAAIANNQPRQFSNAGFGDEWYALWLEEPPKPKMIRQQPPRGGRPF